MEAKKRAWITLPWLILCLNIHLAMVVATEFFKPFNVSYDHRALIIDGHRRMLISAGIHYPRATPEVLFFCFVLFQCFGAGSECCAFVLVVNLLLWCVWCCEKIQEEYEFGLCELFGYRNSDGFD